MAFELKPWLDANVVPLLAGPPQMTLHSWIWNASDTDTQPREILVWLHAGNQVIDLAKEPCTCESLRGNFGEDADVRGDCPRHQYEYVAEQDLATKTPDELVKQVGEDLSQSVQQPLAPTRFDPMAWPQCVKHLLENEGFVFDYLREQIAVNLEGGMIQVFGGDGTPVANEKGMAAARLYKKQADNISLILQVGCQYDTGEEAVAATKAFYQLFDDEPLALVQRYRAVFGQG